jgi:hypothetical protein
MGQAARRELALGLRSTEASLAATRGSRDSTTARLNDGLFRVLLVPWICSRIGLRAETASMLRRSLPFEPTFEHQCQSPAHLCDDADCRRHVHKCARASPSAPSKDC